jgi:hypothetical protein
LLLCFAAAFGETKSDYDRSYSFVGLRTWDFKMQTRMPTDPVGTNTIWNQDIRKAITDRLASDGFQKATQGQPDFLVAYYMGTKERYDTRFINYGFPGGWGGWGRWGRWGGWGGVGDVDVWNIPYTESTVTLDLIDPHTNNLIWRGYDAETLDFNKSEKSIARSVDNLVKRLAHDLKEVEKKEADNR